MAMIGHAKKPTKNLNSIYSRGNFAIISGGTGNKFGHNTGLTKTDSAQKEPYSESYSGGASPCDNPNMELKIKSSCWEGELAFNYAADIYGKIKGCDVVPDGGLSRQEKVDPSTESIGIAISQTDVCGGGFPTGGECGEGATLSIASHTLEVRIRDGRAKVWHLRRGKRRWIT
ncbi:hypothetical protein ACKAV7_002910 [Fusarium commune]|uniref:Uncharacterized protein n=1 Tax=Fusarium oxysporum f. sp. rapae TaxID=485398 RepID=A0A8J5P3B2_FUSOX|nr:hypothetical protein Forpe1208_v004388 [Fusarium oxysporum f. sp. rapae]